MGKIEEPVRLGLTALLLFWGSVSAKAETPLTIPELRLVELDNNLPLYHIHMPDDKTFTLVTLVWGGTDTDPEGMGGLAHVLEHMLFYQADVTTEDYEKQVRSRGGSYNGHTRGQYWKYYVTLPSDEFSFGAGWPMKMHCIYAPWAGIQSVYRMTRFKKWN